MNIAVLALDGGTAGFEGSEVAVGNLSGTGTLNDLFSLTVAGTITAKIVVARNGRLSELLGELLRVT